MSVRSSTVATAPSNIALLKYWGKRDDAQQWPAGDSLSMTLNAAQTTTRVYPADRDTIVVSGTDLTTDRRGAKALNHLQFLRQALDLDGTKAPGLKVESENSFPMGAGIASSASSMAALTIAATAQWLGCHSWISLEQAGLSRTHLAQLARQGSGSAGRSLWGGFVEWRAGDAPSAQTISPVFDADHWPLSDVIVMLDRGEKAVSSSDAHKAAWTSPLFAPRLEALPQRLKEMKAAIAAKDLAKLGDFMETEALEMHAVIMTATPSVHFLNKATIEFITWLRRMRRTEGLAAWFTIDAGPNVHVLCETTAAATVANVIEKSFPEVSMLRDQIGRGPTLSTTPL